MTGSLAGEDDEPTVADDEPESTDDEPEDEPEAAGSSRRHRRSIWHCLVLMGDNNVRAIWITVLFIQNTRFHILTEFVHK